MTGRPGILRLATMVLALIVAVAMGAAGAAAAKKKGGAGVFRQTQSVNLGIPDDAATGPSTPLTQTITVPKKFKGKVVGDLNVTGITTTGNAAGAAVDLGADLTAPNGTVTQLFSFGGGQSIAGWTLDDDTRTSVCFSATPTCADPDASLLFPLSGTSNGLFLANGDTGPLSALNGAPMAGAWRLRIWDDVDVGEASTFNSWGLEITAAKPVTAAAKASAAAKKGESVFNSTLSPNLAIPDRPPGVVPATAVLSSTTAGKAFKGKVVGDLDLIGLRTTGSAAGAAGDLNFKLQAPNGRTVEVFRDRGDESLGPLSLDDESTVSICDAASPPCADPSQTLNRPFAGTANLLGAGTGGIGPLSAFDGVPIRGTWMLSVFDGANTRTSTLNSWGLRITAAKPPKGIGGGKKAKAAKKKKGQPKAFEQQLSPNLAIPQDAPAAGVSTAVTSAITVPKKFKGLSVGDLDVTGVQTAGSAASAADDLQFRLIAPNGNTSRVIREIGDQSLGPLTLNDEAAQSICDAPTASPCSIPSSTLAQPFAGSAYMLFAQTQGAGPLSFFDGGPMRGSWTLKVVDLSGAATTSTLTSWGLRIAVAKPIK